MNEIRDHSGLPAALRAALLSLAMAMFSALPSTSGRAAPQYRDHRRLLYTLDSEGREQPVRTAAEWERRRAHVLAAMQEVMGPLPPASPDLPLEMEVLETVATERFTRQKIRFVSEIVAGEGAEGGEKDRVPAYLLLPRGRGRRAAVLCLHQTTRIGKEEPAGLGGQPNLRYARELAERGFVTLAPDYPNFGEYRFDPYAHGYASGSMKAIRNNMRAVDLLQSLPQVDGARIGCIGHSLGGHTAIFTAVFDTRLQATVSSCGFTAFHAYYGGNLAGWTGPTYMPRIQAIGSPDRMPFDFHELVAALAPRAFFACAPLHDANFDNTGVREVMRSAEKVYRLLGVPERLVAAYPDAGHDFPPAEREAAYRFLARWLAPRTG